MLAYGIGDLQEAALIPGHGQIAFSLATAIPPTSWYGTLLSGLFNFTPEPTWLQFIAWLAYLVIITTVFLRRAGGGRAVTTTVEPTANTAATPVVVGSHH